MILKCCIQINTFRDSKQIRNSARLNPNKLQKNPIFLRPTKKMEQNELLNKPFEQPFHITDIKHNIIGFPFITKYIPNISIIDSKIDIKNKYRKMNNTALTFFQRMNKQRPIFSKFYPIYNKEKFKLRHHFLTCL